MKEVINYYRSLGSNLFVCFIDIKGAFDRVNYNKLFYKLIQRGAPKYLIMFLCRWYSTQRLYVRWGNATSSGFGMSNGIRQESKLSPYLFKPYIDQLNVLLYNSRVGYHVAGSSACNFGYADDLALVAPSAKALNTLLEICDLYATENDILKSL